MASAEYWIEKLELQPHPEGGWFRETYRSDEEMVFECLPERFFGNRSFSTMIYFLLEARQFSAMHRIRSDECWHFYTGSSLIVHVIHPDGKSERIRLGDDPEQGAVFQAVVPHGSWFGAKLDTMEGYALVGCTVAPGFDFADFELAEREKLIRTFPDQAEMITILTKS